MKRWTLLFAGAALWLFLAAIPALADGGPHVATVNSGSGGLTADSCAGCHRAHTAQGLYLLVGADGPAACLTCHGENGFGATTDVETGLQYTPSGASGTERGAALGALRSGGFLQARIASDSAYAIHYQSGTNIRRLTKVPVGPATASTSAHLPIVGGEVAHGTATAWGYGADSATPDAGTTVTMECVTCHNPHGNNQYRILRTFTARDITETLSTEITPLVDPGVAVTDSPTADLIPAGDARNYTVIQTFPTSSLLASDVDGYGSTAGDYFRRRVPWNATATGSYGNDAPNGAQTFYTEISNWCLTCHQRYASTGWDDVTTDAIYHYRHTSAASSRNCITCHVAHGSNAKMTGPASQAVAFPDNITNGVFSPISTTPSTDSRLLKLDNRGTCQACHEPTGTAKLTDAFGPVPNPLVP